MSIINNKDRANRIKKMLGLRGNDDEKEYYRVADVICDLKHFCDYYPKSHPDYPKGIEFDNEFDSGIRCYIREKSEEVA
jgi:hypothetical protein|tara:strand:+ start:404 stop:640 length:237 start_codon:yes stop_codon:yes gene_type:complete